MFQPRDLKATKILLNLRPFRDVVQSTDVNVMPSLLEPIIVLVQSHVPGGTSEDRGVDHLFSCALDQLGDMGAQGVLSKDL